MSFFAFVFFLCLWCDSSGCPFCWWVSSRVLVACGVCSASCRRGSRCQREAVAAATVAAATAAAPAAATCTVTPSRRFLKSGREAMLLIKSSAILPPTAHPSLSHARTPPRYPAPAVRYTTPPTAFVLLCVPPAPCTKNVTTEIVHPGARVPSRGLPRAVEQARHHHRPGSRAGTGGRIAIFDPGFHLGGVLPGGQGGPAACAGLGVCGGFGGEV